MSYPNKGRTFIVAKTKLPNKHISKNKLELAWVAGIIDGEGTITLIKNPTPSNIIPRIMLTMCHKQTVIKVWRILGRCCTVRYPKKSRNPKHKIKYAMQFNSRIAISITKLLLPFLVTKKRQAKVLLEWENKVKPVYNKHSKRYGKQLKLRYKLLKRIQRLNKRGAL